MFEFYRNNLTYEKAYEVFKKIIQAVGEEVGEKEGEVSEISLGTLGRVRTPTHIEEVIPRLREIFSHVPNITDIIAKVLGIKSFSKLKFDNINNVVQLDIENAVIYNNILFFENPLSTVAEKTLLEKNNYASKDLLFNEIGIIDRSALEYIKSTLNDNVSSDSKTSNDLYFIKKFNDLLQWAIENKGSLIKIYPSNKTFKSALMIDGMFFDKYIKDTGEINDYSDFIKGVKEEFSNEVTKRVKYNNKYYKAVLKSSFSTDFFKSNEVLYLSINEYTNLDYKLSDINLNYKDRDLLSTHLKSPSGVIIVSGNKSSGKRTVLLGMLDEIQKTRQNLDIISFENYLTKRVEGIDQLETGEDVFEDTQADGTKTLSKTAHAVVGILNVAETSLESAFSLAQQGKLVILTVNSSSIFNTINLLSKSVKDKNKIVENLLCLVHVGLVRKVCKSCSSEKEFSTIKESPFFLSLDKVPSTTEKVKVHHLHGCQECNDGYLGRVSVSELIDNDKIARESLLKDDVDKLRLEKRSSNWRSVYESSMELLKDKQVTLDSIIEAIGIYRKV